MRSPLSSYHARTLIFLLIAISLSACPDHQPKRDELERNRQRWQSQHLTAYRYQLHATCLCPELSRPVIIEVHNGTASIREQRQHQLIAGQPFAALDSVEDLFGLLQAALDRQAASVMVSYDPQLGFPTYIRIDDTAFGRDDSIEVSITHFESIE